MVAITDVARMKGKQAITHRIPVETLSGLPRVEILQGIAKFSNLTRQQLAELQYEDLYWLKVDAEKRAEVMDAFNNETAEQRIETYLELKRLDEEHFHNMTVIKEPDLKAAQAAVLGAGSSRKKRAATTISSNIFLVIR